MNPIAVCGTGMVCSVGYSAASSCAAIRAKLSNPTATTFIDPAGEWINGHAVMDSSAIHGFDKLPQLASNALREALRSLEPSSWREVPMLLCVAEKGRPGRSRVLDDELFLAIEEALGCEFSPHSAILDEGRVGVVSAIQRAAQLLHSRNAQFVAVLAVDSLLTAPVIRQLVEQERLLMRSREMGDYLVARLGELQARHAEIGDVRGMGLLRGIELVKDRETRKPHHELGALTTARCLELGLSMNIRRRPERGSVWRIAPPLTVKREDIDLAMTIFDQALTEMKGVVAGRRSGTMLEQK